MVILNIPRSNKFVALVLSLALGSGHFLGCQSVWAETSELNFKVYSPEQPGVDSAGSGIAPSNSGETVPLKSELSPETAQSDANADKINSSSKDSAEIKGIDEAGNNEAVSASDKSNPDKDLKAETSATVNTDGANSTGSTKVLQGYVKIVPTGTKIPIVMDTAVDSDTSQEGDEFSARTVEDLTIDGTTVIPAGSIIRGRIATLNSPKHLNRSGSVALKFDTVTTPDNRQIPLVATLVARGGVVHARRGMKDIAIDSATFGLPTLVALGIGAVAGHGSSSVGIGGGALIGAGVGAAVGLAILMAKKGKKVDVRPGDELKIELAEDLHMPAM